MSENSFSSDEDDDLILMKRRKRKRSRGVEFKEKIENLVCLRLEVIQKIIAASYFPERRFKAPNVHRKRPQALEFVRSWTDFEFQCQFRLKRPVFNACLVLLNDDLKKDEMKAKCSSGSSISPEMMFLITLHILAGGSYLDMIWVSRFRQTLI